MNTQCLEHTGFKVFDLGRVDYDEAYQIQENIVDAVILGKAPILLLCEHPSVLTMGRLAKDEFILASEDELDKRGVRVLKIDRGGEVTLHNPGQLVIYPIIDLKKHGRNLKEYLGKLESIAIEILKEFAIVPRRNPTERGVWVDAKKIVSIGIGVKKWVSYHGLGINVCNDLSEYALIKPCGLDVQMTSMSDVLKRDVSLEEVKERILKHFTEEFRGV